MRTSRNEKEEEEEEKKKRKTRDALHKCYASHRIKKKRKLAQRYMNATLRTALKRKTRDALHKHNIKCGQNSFIIRPILV